MKLVAYCRQSLSEVSRTNVSIAHQLASIADYAKNNDIEVVNVYSDRNDGSSLYAPGLMMAIGDLEKVKADGILVYSADRITTSVADFEHLIQKLFKTKKLISIDFQVDFDTADGRACTKIHVIMAQYDRERQNELKYLMQTKDNEIS